MSNVLITGAGNVGAAIGREFLDKGYNVVFYDLAETPPALTADFILEAKDRVTFVKGDIFNFDYLLETAEKYKIEGIVHTALYGAKASKTRTMSTFRNSAYPNIDMLENILEAARLKGLKVINISSIVAYGAAVSSGRWPIDKPLTENEVPQLFPMAPPGPYDSPNFASYHSCTKRILEELTTFYFQEYGLHVCSMRIGSVYGPLDTKVHLLPIMIRRALAGKSFEIPKGGDSVEDSVYNKDLARAIYSAFTTKQLKRSVYNITSGKIWKHAETAELIMKIIPGSVIKLGPGMFPGGSFGVSYVRPPISIKAAQEELGYKVTPLEVGIKETAEWMKKNWNFVPIGYFEILSDSWWVK